MNQTKPIKSYRDIQKFKQYYIEKGEYRNYLLVTICLNSALRISDVLKIKTEDIYNFADKSINTHIVLKEQKTGKYSEIYLNSALLKAFKLYAKRCGLEKGFIFKNKNGNALSRVQAYRIIKDGANAVGLDISCHSLRKTFGYCAWKAGVSPVLLMKIYNHSSFEVTKRYLGIEQKEKDSVFEMVRL